jgi:hypothetical protein
VVVARGLKPAATITASLREAEAPLKTAKSQVAISAFVCAS